MAIKYNVSEKGNAGRRLLQQVMAARQWAEMKANRRFKKEKLEKEPYKPGVTLLGLSAVSKSIMEVFGEIIPRRERRKYYTHDVFYNGEGPVRTPHNIAPSKYARR